MKRPGKIQWFLFIAIVWLLVNALCALYLVSCAFGQAPSEATQHSMCRIWTAAGCGGSGTLVDKCDGRGLVITCAHLFRDSQQVRSVTFPGGETFGGAWGTPCTLLQLDASADLAAVEIPAPAAEPVAIAAAAPRKGDGLASAGFGGASENRVRVNVGEVTHYGQVDDGTWCLVKLTGTTREGDSGGPIFNQAGELAAVQWGSNGEGVYGAHAERVAVFLAQCRGRWCRPRAQPPRPVYQAPAPYAQQPPTQRLPATTPPPQQATPRPSLPPQQTSPAAQPPMVPVGPRPPGGQSTIDPERLARIEEQLGVIARKESPACDCRPADLSAVVARLVAIETAIAANAASAKQCKEPLAAQPPPRELYLDIVRRKPEK